MVSASVMCQMVIFFYLPETRVSDDLRFVVPLSTGKNLCYKMQGLDNLVFNLISHPLITVNTLLITPENESNLIADATFMTDIGIMVQSDYCKGGCQPTRMLISAGDRSFNLYSSKTVITDRSVFVQIGNSTASVHLGRSMKNKQSPSLIVAVKKPRISIRFSFVNKHLDMIITDDRGLDNDCHGIIGESLLLLARLYIFSLTGQFLYREAHITNEVMKINSKVTEIEEKPVWDTNIPCLYAKPHYGDQAEGILEGQFTDYIMDSIFSTEFSYSNFKTNQCKL